ncbi:energy transducer TonB [Granulicella sp. S190]|uniref:energy transducer TonB n=1 Tax=Granulicella sp. S190 TaxID=1747226 RepID=UPI00131C27D4|nr:energy transducer TonB [Granulicella sp. S190]
MKFAFAILFAAALFCASSPAQSSEQKAPVESENAPASTDARPPTINDKIAKDHLLKRVDAPYPPLATAAHVSGTIVLGVEIDPAGAVTKVVVLSGPEMLRSAAVNAVKQYIYNPFLINGTASKVRTAVQVKFEPFHSKSS